jgi:TolB-like protein
MSGNPNRLFRFWQDDKSLEKTIAVLPFLNLVGDPDQEYICVGLTDEIITNLYKIESFDKVVSLTSVLSYSDTDKKTHEIADELSVNYILEGTYKKIGDQLRVTAQLIEANNDRHTWARNYDRPYEDIITIPADIALQIADHLKAYITGPEKQNIQKIPTTNQEAYELLLRVGYIFNTRGYGMFSETLDLALEAIRLDPNYAEAYAMQGLITLFKGIYIGHTDMQSAAMEALPFFEKAIELDRNNAFAHMGMGVVNELARWEYIEAKYRYFRSIELEPNNSALYTAPIEFLVKMGQFEDARILIKKSQAEDRHNYKLIQSHVLSDNKVEALDLLSRALSDEFGHPYKGNLYLWLEKYDSARYYLESALQSGHHEMTVPRFQACLALAYYKTEDLKEAKEIIAQLIDKSDTTAAGSPAYFTGWYYSWIGEVDSAFFWLEKAYQNRSPEMPWLKVDPAFKNLKDDSRYWDLYERTGHKAYDDYLGSRIGN